MADPPEPEAADAIPRPRRWRRAAAKYLLLLPLLLVGSLVLLVIGLDTAIGHRVIADLIGGWEARSGLRIRVARIEGSIYGRMQLDDVAFSDSRGVFLRLPAVRVDWRPLAWAENRLDIRELASTRGVLLRIPQFRVTEPNGPLLPGFDIRADKVAIERLAVDRAVLGVERRVDLQGRVLVRARRALVAVDGTAGGGDRLLLDLDADETADRFRLGLDYAAPRGGLLAALTGANASRRLRIGGKGSWTRWTGGLLAEQDGSRLAALQLVNRSGQFDLAGQAFPAPVSGPAMRRLLGDKVGVLGSVRLADNVLSGHVSLSGAPSRWSARGGIDLGRNALRHLALDASITDPAALGPGTAARGLRAAAMLDGPLLALTGNARVAASELKLGETRLIDAGARADLTREGSRWKIPLELTAARVATGNAAIDPRLVNGHAHANLRIDRGAIAADAVAIDFPGLAARLALRGNIPRADYALAGPVAARRLALSGVGAGDANARIVLRFGKAPWTLGMDLAGKLTRIDNRTLATVAGDAVRFAARIETGGARPLLVAGARIDSTLLALRLAGRQAGATTVLSGTGHQATYGSFTIAANIAGDGPHATLVFADPFPAAGVRNMRVALTPAGQGFHIETAGDSTVGPFTGALLLELPSQGAARIAIERFAVWKTGVTGQLILQPGGVEGQLGLAGGGVDGRLALAPRAGGQGLDLSLTIKDASFGGDQPIVVGQGKVEAHGLLVRGHTTLEANLYGAGIGQGRLFLGQVSARTKLVDGNGQVTAALAGRRGSRFQLQLLGEIAPSRLSLLADGSFAGQHIAMPRRARFSAEAGGWRLAPTEIDFGGGRAIASGLFTAGARSLDLALDSIPLSLGDVVFANLGVGGTATGLLHFERPREGPPTGEAKMLLRQLTRSGLVLTSRPIDLALVGRLTGDAFEARAVAREDGQVRGRLQATIAHLAPGGPLGERLRAAPLFAQLRYDGPADAIWRLMAIEHFDMTGPLAIAADIGGTLDDPRIRGSLAGNGLRLQSALTGTDVSQVALRGGFTGSQLTLDTMSGRTVGNGEVTGSGVVRFSEMSTNRGPAFDIRLALRNAMLLSRPDMALAATGPLRIVFDGLTGTVAGRLSIDSARWRLGQSQAAAGLPNIPTREINRGADVAPASVRAMPWRFLVDAAGRNRIRVIGLGIESEWGADIRLRGTVDAPAIGGAAQLVQGTYEFAGKRFDLTRGRIAFDGKSPPDPRLDISASAAISGLTATVTVGGTSLKPEIAFSSIPAMPEEELLSRLLFGDSITQISAPEALQLGAALASLHGGGGLDPINRLRSAIGLDRLRIVNADPTLNRQTGVAAGKYLGRHFYAEIVTDGRGYSATNLEYRITNWLSLLGTVSTVNRQSVNAKISKDY